MPDLIAAPASGAVHRPVLTSLGLIVFTSTFTTQWMLILFFTWGALPFHFDKRFPDHIRDGFRPERDLQVYSLSIITGLCMTAAGLWLARRKSRLNVTPTRNQKAAECFLAIIGFAAGLYLISHVQPSLSHLLLAPIPTIVIFIGTVSTSVILPRFSRHLCTIVYATVCVAFVAAQLSVKPIALVAIMFVGLFAVIVDRYARRRGRSIDWDSLLLTTLLLCLCSGIGFMCILGLGENPWTTASSWRSITPAIGVLIAFTLAVTSRAFADFRRIPFRRISLTMDVLISLFIFSILMIPHRFWPSVAGYFFQVDRLHHWNFFAFGPALAYSHHRAMATEIFSQYGVALPVLLSAIRPLVPLSYANSIGLCVTGGSVYFVLLYIFLRLLLRSGAWAMTGTMVAIFLQIFCGSVGQQLIWNYPSSTMLRHPIDVICFAFLLMEVRSRRTIFLYLAAISLGAAILFELDTGIHLAIVIGFFLLLQQWRPNGPARGRTTIVGATLLTVGVWLIGLYIVSHGHLLSRRFWIGYTEGIRLQAFSGLGLLPIAEIAHSMLATFATMVAIYLACIAWGGYQTLTRDDAEIEPFLAMIGAYGLGILMLFVGRSHPLNLYHVMVPLGVVVAIGGYLLTRSTAGPSIGAVDGWCAAAVVTILLFTKPEFFVYPNMLRSASLATPTGLILSTHPLDLAGFPTQDKIGIDLLKRTAKAIRTLPAQDADVLILDEQDTLLYYLSGRAPWSSKTSLFHGLYMWSDVRDLQAQIASRRPKYIVMHDTTPNDSTFIDIRTALRRTVDRHYRVIQRIGHLQFWLFRK